MRVSRFLVSVLVAGAMFAAVSTVEAGSIGRSSGSSFSSSRSSSSFSSSSYRSSSPSIAPSKPSGIGGSSGSMGVRKSAVTDPIKAKSAPPVTATSSAPVTSAPSYSAPAYSGSGGGGFMSSFGGSFLGTSLGMMMFGNHGGQTVINGGGGNGVAGGPVTVVESSSGFGSVIMAILQGVLLIALLIGVAFLCYKGYKMIGAYVRKERGGSTQPFNPTERFWEIQRAFAAADLDALKPMLGPDLMDEATQTLRKSELKLSGVSHEVVLDNSVEFSVHYLFNDAGDSCSQVWHYERFGSVWKLNGIENI